MLTPIHTRPIVITYEDHNLSFINTYELVSKSSFSRKKVLKCHACAGKCSTMPKCQIDNYYSLNIHSCPYYYFSIELTEPRKNSSSYNDWNDIVLKLQLKQAFGKYAAWVFENKDVDYISEEEFNQLKEIDVFSLERLTGSRLSYDKILELILENPNNSEINELYLHNQTGISVPLINTLINTYVDLIKRSRDVRSLCSFMSEEDQSYEAFKRGHKELIIQLGEYYVTTDTIYQSLWAEADKDNSNIYKEKVKAYGLDNKDSFYSQPNFYFHESQVEAVIKWAKQSQGQRYNYYTQYIRYLVEFCEDLLRKFVDTCNDKKDSLN